MAASKPLTLADVVVLSMLAERAQHGYELWAELERREVQEWASISKPQVYYSLNKLEAATHIELASDPDSALGPDRRIFRPTPSGRRALASALARAEWATETIPSPFVTWMVLSWQARPRDFVAQIGRRRRFLTEKIAFERDALDSIIAETSPSSDAAMIVRLAIAQQEIELAWLSEVAARHRPG